MASDLRSAASAALEALELAAMNGPSGLRSYEVHELDEAITALKQALAEPEQEPVAWGMMLDGQIYDCICPEEHAREEGEYTIPLYTAPTPRKPLTEGEMPTLFVGGLALNSEATTEIVRAVEKAHGITGETK